MDMPMEKDRCVDLHHHYSGLNETIDRQLLLASFEGIPTGLPSLPGSHLLWHRRTLRKLHRAAHGRP